MSFSREFIAGCAELGIFKPNDSIPNLETIPEINAENYTSFLNQTRNPIKLTINDGFTTGLPLLDTIVNTTLKGVIFNQPPAGTSFIGCCAEAEPNFNFSLRRADKPHALSKWASVIVEDNGEPKLFFKSHGDVAALMLADDLPKGLVGGALGVVKGIAFVIRQSPESPQCIQIPLSAVDKAYPIRMSAMSLSDEVRNPLTADDPSATFLRDSLPTIVERTKQIMKAPTTKTLSHEEAQKILVAGKYVYI